jgi:predicted ribosome quality control (RQC) complex YloA/Tae2 family protein
VANPGDLWFHARGTPGAHVVLQRDDRRTPSQRDVEFAASLAAAHSKARASGKVPVDYTQRKHVRKRPDAPPGLVWYAQAKTAIVTPYVEPLPG